MLSKYSNNFILNNEIFEIHNQILFWKKETIVLENIKKIVIDNRSSMYYNTNITIILEKEIMRYFYIRIPIDEIKYMEELFSTLKIKSELLEDKTKKWWIL